MPVVNYDGKITLWKIIGNDGLGDNTYSRKIVDGKWVNKQERFTDINGDVSISKSVFYTLEEISPETMFVLFGESTEAQPTEQAEKIKAITNNPSMFPDFKGWV